MEDTFEYFRKYRAFLMMLTVEDLPGDSTYQWSFHSYVMFREVVLSTCRISLCNILMVISEFYGLNMERRHGMIMANIL